MWSKVFTLLLLLGCGNANVNFYLFTRLYSKEKLELGADVSLVDSNNLVKFIIHGWGESSERHYYQDMTEAYLIKGDYNVIQVDWNGPAGKPYFQAVINTKQVGSAVGEFVLKLNKEASVPLTNVHIIGHSLGAHVSGFAGKRVFELSGEKVKRISGLDPAGPGFEDMGSVDRLDKEDAVIVDNTHTDSNYFGYAKPLGTVDFYANGGHRPQPGCELFNPAILKLDHSQIAFCSHTRSYLFFIESINTDSIVGTECTSYSRYLEGNCNRNNKIVYGEDMPLNLKGVFYFRTNEEKPYAYDDKV